MLGARKPEADEFDLLLSKSQMRSESHSEIQHSKSLGTMNLVSPFKENHKTTVPTISCLLRNKKRTTWTSG